MYRFTKYTKSKFFHQVGFYLQEGIPYTQPPSTLSKSPSSHNKWAILCLNNTDRFIFVRQWEIIFVQRLDLVHV